MASLLDDMDVAQLVADLDFDALIYLANQSEKREEQLLLRSILVLLKRILEKME